MATDPREPYGRISHAAYRDWLAGEVQRVYGDVAQLGSWEDLTEGMREAYMLIGSAVAARAVRDAGLENVAREAEVRQVIATFFTVHGNNSAASLTAARDVTDGILQVLDRVPLGGATGREPG